MTETNPEQSPPEARPYFLSFCVHVIFGYTLYGVALLQSPPSEWALNVIERLKPTLGALDTAARLSEHPFPIQVMILYTVSSAFPLGLYWVYYTFLVKHVRQKMYRRLCEHLREQLGQTGIPFRLRLGFFGFGLAQLFIYGYYLPIHYFVEGGHWFQGYRSGWLDLALFSSSILSATSLLLVPALFGAGCVAGPLSFYLSVSRIESPTSVRR